MNSLLNSDLCKSIRPMYIFTVLCFLLGAVLWTITHHEAQLPESVAALLNIIAGGLLAQIGAVVNYEFGSAKPREALAKPPAGTTIDSTTTISASTPAQEPSK